MYARKFDGEEEHEVEKEAAVFFFDFQLYSSPVSPNQQTPWCRLQEIKPVRLHQRLPQRPLQQVVECRWPGGFGYLCFEWMECCVMNFGIRSLLELLFSTLSD